jgi:hypothetical protein
MKILVLVGFLLSMPFGALAGPSATGHGGGAMICDSSGKCSFKDFPLGALDHAETFLDENVRPSISQNQANGGDFVEKWFRDELSFAINLIAGENEGLAAGLKDYLSSSHIKIMNSLPSCDGPCAKTTGDHTISIDSGAWIGAKKVLSGENRMIYVSKDYMDGLNRAALIETDFSLNERYEVYPKILRTAVAVKVFSFAFDDDADAMSALKIAAKKYSGIEFE